MADEPAHRCIYLDHEGTLRRRIDTIVSESEGAFEALQDQPEDGRQVEAADLGCRLPQGAEGFAFDGAVTRG